MMTVDELFEILKRNLAYYYKVKYKPKRCYLNNYFGLINEPGYIVELAHDDGGIDLLFIADIANNELLHCGSSAFVTNCFKNKCLWVDDDDIIYINTEGFYI